MPQKEPVPNPSKFRNMYNKPAALFCCSISSILTIVLTLFYSNLFANYAYVTSTLVGVGNKVFIIDTATNLLLPSTISVSNQPFGIAINPLGNYVYTSCFLGNDIAVIDTSTNSVAVTIPVGTNPYHAIATTPDGRYLYVGNSGSANVSVIDTATNLVITTIDVGHSPNGCAITPDGKYLYVANTNSNNVSVINTSTNEVVATTTVGTHPHGVAITPDGQFAYVANMDSNDISIIDIATNTVSDTIILAVGVQPFVLAITPDGLFAYVTNHNNTGLPLYYVYVIKISDNTVYAEITGTGSQPNGIAITPDGESVYVSNYSSNNISVIDTTTYGVTLLPFTIAEPGGIAITLPLLPPQNLTGKQEKNDFGFEYELFNLLNWNTPQFYGFAGFFVYRNGSKIATLNRYARQYSDHGRIKGSSATYSVTSFSPAGEESDPITVQIN